MRTKRSTCAGFSGCDHSAITGRGCVDHSWREKFAKKFVLYSEWVARYVKLQQKDLSWSFIITLSTPHYSISPSPLKGPCFHESSWGRVPSENSLDYIILFRIHQNACRPAIMFVWLFLTAQRPRDFYADRHEYDQPTATGPIGKWTSELARNLHIRNVLPWESQTWEWDCVRNKQR